MATIPWDVYRIGDQNGAGLDLIRPGLDVTVVNWNNTDWVLANTGGASTRLRPHTLRNPNDRWWQLRAGSPIQPLLTAVRDSRNHVSWEPLHHMLLSEYISALASMNGLFV
jgi:hypothetical protein